MLEDRVVALTILFEDARIDAKLLSDVLDNPRRHFGYVGQRAAGKSEHSEMDGEAQPVGGSTMAIDDVQVAARQRIEATESTLRQIRRDAHERVALFSGEQARRLGYHATRSAGMRVRQGVARGLPNLSQYAF
jgi:hypothetical protein